MGCAALTPSRQMLSVTSNVPDAVILVNGENIGFGSGKTEVKRNSTVNIMAIKDGYYPAIRTIGKHNNIGAIFRCCGLWIWTNYFCNSLVCFRFCCAGRVVLG